MDIRGEKNSQLAAGRDYISNLVGGQKDSCREEHRSIETKFNVAMILVTLCFAFTIMSSLATVYIAHEFAVVREDTAIARGKSAQHREQIRRDILVALRELHEADQKSSPEEQAQVREKLEYFSDKIVDQVSNEIKRLHGGGNS